MNEKTDQIIEKAKQLSLLISEHPSTCEYTETTEKMKKDFTSQRLLERLVFLGRDINEMALSGQPPELKKNQEYEFIKNELDGNQLVKRHITAQKEYLALLKGVIQRIRGDS